LEVVWEKSLGAKVTLRETGRGLKVKKIPKRRAPWKEGGEPIYSLENKDKRGGGLGRELYIQEKTKANYEIEGAVVSSAELEG